MPGLGRFAGGNLHNILKSSTVGFLIRGNNEERSLNLHKTVRCDRDLEDFVGSTQGPPLSARDVLLQLPLQGIG